MSGAALGWADESHETGDPAVPTRPDDGEAQPSGVPKRRLAIGLIISALVVWAVVSAVAYGLPAQSGTSSPGVSTFKVVAQPDFLFMGTVEAAQTNTYNLDSSQGVLKQVNVHDGQHVQAGDVLLTYQSTNANLTQLTFSVQTAQNTLTNAQDEVGDSLSRIKEFQKKLAQTKDPVEKTTIQNEIDSDQQTLKTSQRAVTTAQLGLSQAQTSLDQAQNGQVVTVKAPQAGIIQLDPNAAATNTAQTSQPLLTLVSDERIVRGTVSEFDYGRVHVGNSVGLTSLNKNETTSGVISAISMVPLTPATSSPDGTGATVVSYSFTVTPKVPMQYGYSVQIKMKNDDIVIPESALKGDQVKLKTGSGFETRTVKSEKGSGEIIVRSGLRVGDVIARDWSQAAEAQATAKGPR